MKTLLAGGANWSNYFSKSDTHNYFTIKTAGVYRISAQLQASNSGSRIGIGIWKSGIEVSSAFCNAANVTTVSCDRVFDLSAGESIYIKRFSEDKKMTMALGRNSHVTIQYLGPSVN